MSGRADLVVACGVVGMVAAAWVGLWLVAWAVFGLTIGWLLGAADGFERGTEFAVDQVHRLQLGWLDALEHDFHQLAPDHPDRRRYESDRAWLRDRVG